MVLTWDVKKCEASGFAVCKGAHFFTFANCPTKCDKR